MTRKANRREFIKGAAAASAGFWIATHSAFGEDPQAPVAPSEKLNVGFVGVGGRGGDDLNGISDNKLVNVVALTDVDQNTLNSAAKRFPKAKLFSDFRKMLDEKEIDAVCCGTPDHLHFHVSMMAIESGRHIYCEKPLTHKVLEARALTEAAMNAKRVTQLGTQIHAEGNYRRVVELIRAGAIGSVKEVHVMMNSGWSAGDRPTGTPPVPPTLDYDLWVGPAEFWPYHPAYLPQNWRSWWNFGNGRLGDMACHHIDLPFWALGLKYPSKITPVSGDKVHPDGCPENITVKWDFPADGDRKEVSLFWYGGDDNKPKQKKEWGVPDKFNTGNIFVGEKGVLYADYGSLHLLPEKDFKDYKAPEQTIKPSIGHHNEWVEACKTGDHLAPLCNFSYGGPLSETVLLGCVAYRTQQALEWDGKLAKVTNTRDADQYLKRQYRKGWELTYTV